MIDIEKLQLADKLANEAIENGHKSLIIEYNFSYGCASCVGHSLYLNNFDGDFDNCDIDEIIDELRVLAAPKPKYKESQKVWFIDCTISSGPIMDGVIEAHEKKEMLFGRVQWYCKIGDFLIPEDCLYPTCDALIQAQLDYWQSLNENLEEATNEQSI
jgi:hypothetical protein